jgi:hypothetical protein
MHNPHDPASCSSCDHLIPEAYRRHWKREEKASPWHVIADGPDLMARVPTKAHFITVLAYCFGGEGSPHYQGPLYFEGDADDPAEVVTDARRCIEFLAIEYGLVPEMLRVWLSGGLCFNITIYHKSLCMILVQS